MTQARYIISDAAKMIHVEPHVLRYWEDELGMDIPRNELGHRYYTEKEIRLFINIRDLKEKGFQLKAIKMILSAMEEDEAMDNIIPLKDVRDGHQQDIPEALQERAPEMGQEALSEDEQGDVPKAAQAVSQETVQEGETGVQESEKTQVLAETETADVKVSVTPEDKMKHFKYIMDAIVSQALQENNATLEAAVTQRMAELLAAETEHLLKQQEEMAEKRFRALDEALRMKTESKREVAAAKVPTFAIARTGRKKKGLFKRRYRY